MIKISAPREPYWIDLYDGARIQVRPKSSAVMVAAISETAGMPEGVDRDAALTCAIAKHAIVAWEGIGDQDGNELSPAAPGAVEGLMDDWRAYFRFTVAYVNDQTGAEAEKNG